MLIKGRIGIPETKWVRSRVNVPSAPQLAKAWDKEMIVMRKMTVVRKDKKQGSNLTIICELKENSKQLGQTQKTN